MMQKTVRNCSLCDGVTFSPLGTVKLGGWKNKEADSLERFSKSVTIGECGICSHVQVIDALSARDVSQLYNLENRSMINYEDFSKLAVNNIDINSLEFLQPEILFPGIRIADLGCGKGFHIAAIQHLYNIDSRNFTGIDFSNVISSREINFIKSDINKSAQGGGEITGLSKDHGFFICSHVLEHTINPRLVMSMINNHLSPNGHLYISVPDATSTGNPREIGGVALIHPHHLQYFSPKSLHALAQTTGFDVVRWRYFNRNGTVPQIDMLLQKAKPSGTAAAVSTGIALIARRKCIAAQNVWQRIESFGGAALWGIGAEFIDIISEISSKEGFSIHCNGIQIFDSKFKGKKIDGKLIEDPINIKNTSDNLPVILMSMGDNTRNSMKSFAIANGFPDRIYDPFI